MKLLTLNIIISANQETNCAKINKKVIPVTGRRGLKGCEMLRIRYCLDNGLIDGGKVVIRTSGLTLLPRNIIFLMFAVLISARGCVNPRT
jgi:hypothetical protein